MFRSETMLHKIIKIPRANAMEIMYSLGSIENCIEFVDKNPNIIASQKPYSKIIQRCNEIEAKFLKIESILEERKISFLQYDSYQLFVNHLEQEMAKHRLNINTFFDFAEEQIGSDYKAIEEQLSISEETIKSYITLLEENFVLEQLSMMFDKGEIKPIDSSARMDLFYLSGICDCLDEIKIKRVVFRASLGRAIPIFLNINSYEKRMNNFTKKFQTRKIFFIIVQSEYLRAKILNILEIFNCTIVEVPNENDIKSKLMQTESELDDKEKLIKQGEKGFQHFLASKVNNNLDKNISIYSLYRTYFKLQKLIYQNMNKCNVIDNFLIGEVWFPLEKFIEIDHAMNDLLNKNNEILLPMFDEVDEDYESTPPTFFRTNDFFYPFQEIVNTYGVPRYKEANPGLFTTVSFPFLFGVMFGDIGHGFLLTLTGIYLCWQKDELLKMKLNTVVKFRYIVLLMGFFSFFCGLMYNDFMALPISLFSSCYEKTVNGIVRKPGCVYPLGIDPTWLQAENDIAFTNSFKMKWSVIIGVIQMILGIILKGMNDIFFGDYYSFIFEFIPEIIFMCFIFGYMIVLIFVKWAADWTGREGQSPSIISILMGLALNNGSVDGKPLYTDVLTEEKINRILFYTAISCVPIILLVKPIIKILSMNSGSVKVAKPKAEEGEANEPLLLNINDGEIQKESIKKVQKKDQSEHHQESAGDIFVHQIIMTIEFVLGCVSNTASYLRLWALSLAHAQLSKVFFEKSVLVCAQMNSVLLTVIGFFVFAHITVFVLMGMDLMESFLHTLRLHWVEFQNKFYSADGVIFKPFCFKNLIEE